MSLLNGGTVVEGDFISTSAGAADSGKGVKLNASGVLDGSFIGYFGDGSDGDVTISSPTTLTRDMYYNNLTVNSTLTTDGYKIFVSGTLSGNGTIDWGTPTAGGNGGNGGGSYTPGSAGTAGTASGSGVLKNTAGVAGGAGGSGSGGGGGAQGLAGRIGSAGVAGGRGGDASNGAGTAGAAGTDSTISKIGISSWNTMGVIDYKSDGTLLVRTPIGTGGGSGGSQYNGTAKGGGGGGGSGATGGIIFICVKNWAGTFTIKAIGANGGNGGNGGDASAGVGGGGAGGTGGVSIVIYGFKTWTGSYNLAGGTKGAKGSSGSTTNYAEANNGATGTSYEILCGNLI